MLTYYTPYLPEHDAKSALNVCLLVCCSYLVALFLAWWGHGYAVEIPGVG